MFPDLVDKYRLDAHALRGLLRVNQPLAPFTWLGVGGPAQLFFQPEDEDDLRVFLRALPGHVPLVMIGRGSNLLVRDGGVRGAVIRLSARAFCLAHDDGPRAILAGAAMPCRALCDFAAGKGLGGFAFYAGIPGTIGGAVTMNAGTGACETAGILDSVRGLDRGGARHELTCAQMNMRYRASAPPLKLVYTAARFVGKPCNAGQIAEEIAAARAHREAAQPVGVRTGGSTFKNPPGHSAWKLIDGAGGRGLGCGDAIFSEKHCNFLVNQGGATARDLECLGEQVRARVKERFGIELEWELRRLGQAVPAAGAAPDPGPAVGKAVEKLSKNCG